MIHPFTPRHLASSLSDRRGKPPDSPESQHAIAVCVASAMPTFKHSAIVCGNFVKIPHRRLEPNTLEHHPRRYTQTAFLISAVQPLVATALTHRALLRDGETVQASFQQQCQRRSQKSTPRQNPRCVS